MNQTNANSPSSSANQPTAGTTSTPNAQPSDEKELPTVEVVGVNLVGEIVFADGTLAKSGGLDLIDEGTVRVTHSSEFGENLRFKIPLSKIIAAVVPVRVKAKDRFYFSNVKLPADIAAAINAIRIKSGREPLKDSPPPQADQAFLESRKMVLVLPEIDPLVAHTDPSVLVGVSKENITAISLPIEKNPQGKTLSAWTSVENQSNSSFLRFSWRKTFEVDSSVKFVVAKNETELSRWDGQDDSIPAWPQRSFNDIVRKDYTRCTDLPADDRPIAGSLSATTSSSCGFRRNEFPFTESNEFFIRLTAETASELKLSSIFRIVKNNRSPSLIWDEVNNIVFMNPRTPNPVDFKTVDFKTVDFKIEDTDSALSCNESVSVQVKNSNLQPGFRVFLSGTGPTCRLSFAQPGSNSKINISVADGAGGTAQKEFEIDPRWLVPRVASHEATSPTASSVVDLSGLSSIAQPQAACGTVGNVESRISDCAEKNGDASEHRDNVNQPKKFWWQLVTRTTGGKTLWRDNLTGLIWSDTVNASANWCHASGSNNKSNSPWAEADTICGSAQNGNQNQDNPVSLCAEDQNWLSGQSHESKGGLGILVGATDRVTCYLPSIEDFRLAFTHGAKSVLPGFSDSGEWWSRTVVFDPYGGQTTDYYQWRKGWAFDGSSGVGNPNDLRIIQKKVRCVAR